jgi:protein O-GlcNAc transferase
VIWTTTDGNGNRNGYTKGARNEIFAARPCPVTAQFMGFCGSLGAGWNDWLVADTIATPYDMISSEVWRDRQVRRIDDRQTDIPGVVDPEEDTDSWVYTEKVVFMPHTYFVNDHRQGFREPALVINGQMVEPDPIDPEGVWRLEEVRRWRMRKETFPRLADNVVIFANFNQLYKVIIYRFLLLAAR